MSRKMTFEMIADSRIEGDNYTGIALDRFNRDKAIFENMDGIELEYDRTVGLEFDGGKQLRKRFYIKKDTRKITWNDIYETINNIKACKYDFI